MKRRPSGITVLSVTTIIAAILILINGSIMAAIPDQKISQYGFLGMQIQTPSYITSSLIYGMEV